MTFDVEFSCFSFGSCFLFPDVANEHYIRSLSGWVSGWLFMYTYMCMQWHTTPSIGLNESNLFEPPANICSCYRVLVKSSKIVSVTILSAQRAALRWSNNAIVNGLHQNITRLIHIQLSIGEASCCCSKALPHKGQRCQWPTPTSPFSHPDLRRICMYYICYRLSTSTRYYIFYSRQCCTNQVVKW